VIREVVIGPTPRTVARHRAGACVLTRTGVELQNSFAMSMRMVVVSFMDGSVYDVRSGPIKKRHANWILPRRTRALPALAGAFSRRQAPLSSAAPMRPPYRATALRSSRDVWGERPENSTIVAANKPTEVPPATGE
jgi:hypothetical protein